MEATTLAAGAVLVGTYLQVLANVTSIVGGLPWLLLAAIVAVIAGIALSQLIGERTAIWIAVVTVAVGLGVYLALLPEAYAAQLSVGVVVAEMFAVLTGLPVIQFLNADVWAIAMAPGPTFLTTYLLLRKRYDLAAFTGGLALGVLVLTSDASRTTTLLGMTAALAVVGLGTLSELDEPSVQIEQLVAVLLGGAILARVLGFLPTGEAKAGTGGGFSSTPTLEGSLLSADTQLGVLGSISLSPTPRFTVKANQPAFWHVAAYDRYTGSEWIRTEDGENATLGPPPGDARRVQQTYTAESTIDTMPAAWKPVRVNNGADVDATVTTLGSLTPARSLSEGDTYTVISLVPKWSVEDLQNAGTEYPKAVENRYLRVPDGTPERVARKAREMTADATTAFEKAVAIEQWLETNKEYSLSVSKPGGDVVDGFVFKMKRGYCVYYASAMTVMLRTVGVPARFAVGYTPGEKQEDNEWLIRGLHSHAWVEVFFPEVGWVPFDPTPGEERRVAEQQRVAESQGGGGSGIGVGTSDGPGATPTPTPTPTPTTGPDQTPVGANPEGPDPTNPNEQGTPVRDVAGVPTPNTVGNSQQGNAGPVTTPLDLGSGTRGTDNATASPTPGANERFVRSLGRDRVTLLVGLVGVAFGAHWVGLIDRARTEYDLRFQRRTDSPKRDVERAYERLESLVSREYREPRDGETPREFMSVLDRVGVDSRAQDVASLYERAVYGEDVTREEADEAIELVDDLVSNRKSLFEN